MFKVFSNLIGDSATAPAVQEKLQKDLDNTVDTVCLSSNFAIVLVIHGRVRSAALGEHTEMVRMHAESEEHGSAATACRHDWPGGRHRIHCRW